MPLYSGGFGGGFGGGFIASKASELLLGFNFVEAHIDKMINNSYVLKKYRRKQTFRHYWLYKAVRY